MQAITHVENSIDGHVGDHLVTSGLIVDNGGENPVSTLIMHHCKLQEWQAHMILLQILDRGIAHAAIGQVGM